MRILCVRINSALSFTIDLSLCILALRTKCRCWAAIVHLGRPDLGRSSTEQASLLVP